MAGISPSSPNQSGQEVTGNGIVVLGGTGFVGRALARRWPTELPAPVYLLHRSEPQWLAGSRIDIRRVSLSDPGSVAAAARGTVTFINLLRPDGSGWAAEAIGGVLAALAQTTIRRFVHASSIDVYGATREALVSAATPPEPQTPYEHEHHAIEELVRVAAIEHCIVRLGAVFGEGGRNVKSFVPEIKNGARVKLAARRALYGHRRMHLVSVENVADALILASNNRDVLPEIINVCDDCDAANNFEYVQSTMIRQFGRQPLDRWPLLPTVVLQWLLKARGGDPSRPVRRYSNCELAALGFRPDTSFESRIEAYAALLVAQGEPR